MSAATEAGRAFKPDLANSQVWALRLLQLGVGDESEATLSRSEMTPDLGSWWWGGLSINLELPAQRS